MAVEVKHDLSAADQHSAFLQAEQLVSEGRIVEALGLLKVTEEAAPSRTLVGIANRLVAASTKPELRTIAREGLRRMARYFRQIPPPEYRAWPLASAAFCAAICSNDGELAEAVWRQVQTHETVRTPIVVSGTATLAGWCAATETACELLDAGGEVVLPASSQFSTAVQYRLEPTRFALIAQAWVIPEWDFVIGSDRTVLVDTGQIKPGKSFPGMCVVHHEALGNIIHHWPTETMEVDEDVLFLSPGYLGNFGHWLIGILPRLRARQAVSRPLRVAAPTTLSQKERETLTYFGLAHDAVLWCHPGKAYRFRTVCALSLGTGMPPIPESVSFVRRYLYAATADNVGPRRVYVRRGKVKLRDIENVAEVEALLESEGFVSVDLAGMSWAAQRELLQNAEIILGVWGSNLFATYLAPPGCRIIVLWPPNPARVDPTIIQTCALLGLQHEYFTACSYPDGDRMKQEKEIFVVDCAALRDRIRSSASHSG